MYRKDESKRSKTTETTLTQVWTKKGDDGTTSPDNDSECESHTDLYEFSKKVRSQCRKNNRESRESSERRLALSPSSIPPSTVLCGSTAVAASDEGNESDETNEFIEKRMRRSSSQSSTPNNLHTTPVKSSGIATCDACARKDMKIADLRTKCAQLKGDRDSLREKQLSVHKITSFETEFRSSSD